MQADDAPAVTPRGYRFFEGGDFSSEPHHLQHLEIGLYNAAQVARLVRREFPFGHVSSTPATNGKASAAFRSSGR
jgi:hypothetical protein